LLINAIVLAALFVASPDVLFHSISTEALVVDAACFDKALRQNQAKKTRLNRTKPPDVRRF
jgi:hypothetical protein